MAGRVGPTGTQIPPWYRESLDLDDENFCDGCYGAGFNTRFLEYVVESANGSAVQLIAYQPTLPGLEAIDNHAFE